jgi:hypothetical protein
MPRTERDLEHLLRPSSAGVGLEVVAVEPHAAQLVVARLEPGRYQLDVGDRRVECEHGGGPVAIEVDGLAADREHAVALRDGDLVLARGRLRTSRAPAGAVLSRIATISDLHLGRDTYRASMVADARDDPRSGVPGDGRDVDGHGTDGRDAATRVTVHQDRASRCARAAVREAVAWGAELIVVKGDICEETFDETWDLAAEVLGEVDVPIMLLPGNHDTGSLRRFEPEHGAAERGLELIRGVDHHDLPGLRVVAVDSTVPGTSRGEIAGHAADVADLVRDVRGGGGAFVATHHQPQRWSTPLYWPPGIPGPDARRFARAVRAANPAVLASSGHTHRNRHRRVAGLDWSEVAATSHFPAVWAGYTVYEGGLHQSVRRIAEPGVLAWSEHSRRMLAGLWALWSAGSASDRSFTLDW